MADTHIGAVQYGLAEREQDVYDAFSDAVSHILKEHVKLVLISGDIIDRPRLSGKPLRVLYRELKKLHDKGIDVVAILGEHDFKRIRGEEPIPYLFADQGLMKIIGIGEVLAYRKNVDGLNLLISGLSKHRKTEIKHMLISFTKLEKMIKEINPDRSILMLHQGLKEVNPYAGEISIDQLPRGFNYYAMGHYHVSNSDLRIDEVPIVYPGSLEVIRVDELTTPSYLGPYKCYTSEKGFYIVDISPKEPIIHKVRIDIRPQFKLEVSLEPIQLRPILTRIAESLSKFSKKPVLHIVFKGSELSVKNIESLLSLLIGPHVLTCRWSVEEVTESMKKKPTEHSFDLDTELYNLVRKEMKDDKLAQLVLEILDIVRSDTSEQHKILQLTKLIDRKLIGETR